MVRALLTGSSGLLGRAVLKELVFRGWDTVVLVRDHQPDRLKGGSVEEVLVDLSRPWSKEVLPKKMDVVLHLAQEREFRNFPDRGHEIAHVNAVSTATLLDYATKAGVTNFVIASTGGLYAPSASKLSEESPLIPLDGMNAYFASKMASEVFAAPYSGVFAINILRYFFIYGPNQDQGMLIPRLANKLRRKLAIELDGTDGIRITPTHVEDAAIATALACERKDSATFNVSGNEVVSIRELVSYLASAIGEVPVFATRGQGAGDLMADNSAMLHKLWAPRQTIEQAIMEICSQ